MSIKPLADYVVAIQEAPETKTAAGIFLPEKAQTQSKIAKVTAIGASVRSIKVGDKIIYKSYAPNEFKDGSKDYILVKEEDILATVN